MKEENKTNHLFQKTAAQMGKENLMRLLEDNKDTVYGKKYHFSEIRDVDVYRQTVPLTDYEAYRGYIDDMIRGEKNILTVYPIISFCQTSGTTGLSKYIPVTEEALNRYSDYLERRKNKIIRKYNGKRLFINTFRTDLEKEIESPLLFSEIYYRFLLKQGYLDMKEYVGGKLLLFQKNADDIFYAKVWAAMLAEDIVIMESIFLYDQLCFFHYMEKHWENVLKGIRNRSIPKELKISEKVRKWLLEMEVKEERLVRIEKECRKGFEGIVWRLWPGMRLISGISNRAYCSEDAALKKYTGNIPVNYFCYCASECYMGTVRDDFDFSICLQPQGAFFEFLPYSEEQNENEDLKTLLADELKLGEMYEIIITNFSGLYRYKMGDVIKVTDYQDGCPVFEVLFRKNIALNIAGEKVGVQQIEDVMASIPDYSSRVTEYCFGVSTDNIPENYIVFFSMDDQKEKQMAEMEIANLIDEALRRENADYNDLRKLDRIGKIVAHFLNKDTYLEFMKRNGLMDGHGKPKHVSIKGFRKSEVEGVMSTI